MTDPPPPQLHSILGQLDQALYSHEQWTRNLLRTLIAKLPADPVDIASDAHQRCRFGRWAESREAEPLRLNPAFVAMQQAHERMHRLAGQMLQRGNDGLPVGSTEFDQFSNTLDRMRLELQSLRGELTDILQNRDALTGARNRASLLADLREQQALVRRKMQSCAIAMLDLDHFKRVNDQYGHLAGDQVLATTAQCLQTGLRPYDRLYRYGGEEFLLCLPGSDLPTAAAMAERLRGKLAALPIQVGATPQPLRISASFGISLLDAGVDIEESIDRADRAMYAAKAKGRNRVETWPA